MKVRKRLQRAFTLVELMLVLGILGVLSAIALPIYADFTVRTRVAELVVAASGLKSAVAEKAQQDGSVLTRAGEGLSVSPTGRVTGGTVSQEGAITIFGSQETLGTAVTVVLTPQLAVDGKLIWRCTTDTQHFKFVPNECRH